MGGADSAGLPRRARNRITPQRGYYELGEGLEKGQIGRTAPASTRRTPIEALGALREKKRKEEEKSLLQKRD